MSPNGRPPTAARNMSVGSSPSTAGWKSTDTDRAWQAALAARPTPVELRASSGVDRPMSAHGQDTTSMRRLQMNKRVIAAAVGAAALLAPASALGKQDGHGKGAEKKAEHVVANKQHG